MACTSDRYPESSGLVTRFRRCGQARCRCAGQDDPGHGPAYYLMVTVAPGKTVQVYVPKEHKKLVEAWCLWCRPREAIWCVITECSRRIRGSIGRLLPALYAFSRSMAIHVIR